MPDTNFLIQSNIPVYILLQESLNNNVAFTLQDIDVVTESDLQNNGAINQSPRLVQVCFDHF